MAERFISIWNTQGCKLPNGKLCESCCTKPQIDIGDGHFFSEIKQAHSPCRNLISQNGQAGKGCSLHFSGKPPACSWNCSLADSGEKLDLIAQALASGQVSQAEAELAATRILSGIKARNIEADVQQRVIDRSVFLKNITQNRPTLPGAIIEP